MLLFIITKAGTRRASSAHPEEQRARGATRTSCGAPRRAHRASLWRKGTREARDPASSIDAPSLSSYADGRSTPALRYFAIMASRFVVVGGGSPGSFRPGGAFPPSRSLPSSPCHVSRSTGMPSRSNCGRWRTAARVAAKSAGWNVCFENSLRRASMHRLWSRMQHMMTLFILMRHAEHHDQTNGAQSLSRRSVAVTSNSPVEAAFKRLPQDSKAADEHSERALNVHSDRRLAKASKAALIRCEQRQEWLSSHDESCTNRPRRP